jgi:hypothetical protein
MKHPVVYGIPEISRISISSNRARRIPFTAAAITLSEHHDELFNDFGCDVSDCLE